MKMPLEILVEKQDGFIKVSRSDRRFDDPDVFEDPLTAFNYISHLRRQIERSVTIVYSVFLDAEELEIVMHGYDARRSFGSGDYNLRSG